MESNNLKQLEKSLHLHDSKGMNLAESLKKPNQKKTKNDTEYNNDENAEI
jgi:hypothetical protein